MKVAISNRIYVRADKELLDIIKEELSYKIPVGFGKNMKLKTEATYTRVSSDILSIPSGRLDLVSMADEIIDKRIDTKVVFPKFKFELRKDQSDICDIVDSSCIINANPSWGKTFSGIYTAAKLGRKTLVLVHTKFLLSQWREEIRKTLGIEPGIITAGELDISPPIVVANIQTFRKLTGEFCKTFGTVIVDECHHVPAAMFETVLDSMHAKYKIGLSATIKRKDHRHQFLQDYFSPVIHTPKEEANRLEPIVYKVTIPVDLGVGGSSYSSRLDVLYNDVSYQQAVLNLAMQAVVQGYKVLVVSNRVQLLELFHSILVDESVLITGNTKDRESLIERFVNGGADIIFGTSSIFSEGISINCISCLIPAYPINNEYNLEQLVGRITRPMPGKMTPIVVDINLQGLTAHKQAATRNTYYASKGYEVRSIYFEDPTETSNLTYRW